MTSSRPITVKINKDARLSLSLDGSLTSTVAIAGGENLSVGLSGTLNPGATGGILTVSPVIVAGSGEENSIDNNADKIQYFQQ